MMYDQLTPGVARVRPSPSRRGGPRDGPRGPPVNPLAAERNNSVARVRERFP